jgi:GNAT superfamily N-acetyltransferase
MRYHHKISVFITLCCLLVLSLNSHAEPVLDLPEPGQLVFQSQKYTPAVVMGVNVYPDDPLRFDFIIDQGQSPEQSEAFQRQTNTLIEYFLTALTIPVDEMWVNLSPYEENRVIPASFGRTKMGRDLLAQDYMLKQFTASILHPEKALGEAFWAKVYARMRKNAQDIRMPVNTFNKVWIVPDQATLLEHANGVMIVDAKLRVMLEEDYLALEANQGRQTHGLGDATAKELRPMNRSAEEVIRTFLIPQIEKEVNEGKTFARLRQIYHSMLLASWYKQKVKESLLGQVYVDQKIVKGIDIGDPTINQKIYTRYVEAFEKGVYSFVKEEYDPVAQDVIEKKYFSGGVRLKDDFAMVSRGDGNNRNSPLASIRDKLLKPVVATFSFRLSPKERSAAAALEPVPKEYVAVDPQDLNERFAGREAVLDTLSRQGHSIALMAANQNATEYYDQDQNLVLVSMERNGAPVDLVRKEIDRSNESRLPESIISERYNRFDFQIWFEGRNLDTFEDTGDMDMEVEESNLMFEIRENDAEVFLGEIYVKLQRRGLGPLILNWFRRYVSQRGIRQLVNWGTENPNMLTVYENFVLKPDTMRMAFNDENYKRYTDTRFLYDANGLVLIDPYADSIDEEIGTVQFDRQGRITRFIDASDQEHPVDRTGDNRYSFKVDGDTFFAEVIKPWNIKVQDAMGRPYRTAFNNEIVQVRGELKEDPAMAVRPNRTAGPDTGTKGGIDLNVEAATIEVAKDQAGFQAAVLDKAAVRNIAVDSIVPTLIKITPVQNIEPLLSPSP